MGSHPEERDQALDRAVRALARRDHSVRSLRKRLERAGVSEPVQEETVDALVREGYLDDERFALGRAELLAERGYGDEWIRADLEAQGVDAEAADRALAALDPELERALREVAKLSGGVRAARVLARRGFSEDALEGVLARGPLRTTPEQE
jgi:regulatory protein